MASTIEDRRASVERRRRGETTSAHVPAARDPNALVASAAVLTGANPSRVKMDVESWQTLAWSFYDELGELRFATNAVANAMSRVNLIAAIPPTRQGDEPTPVDLEETPGLRRYVELVEQIAGGPAGQGQVLAGIARQLTVPGAGYVLARADEQDRFAQWRVLSNEEARRQAEQYEYADELTGEWTPLGENDLLIKVWRAHPRKAWLPDSPTRSALSVLQEISLLSKRVMADALSRLAGNGLLVLPTEMEFPPGQGQGTVVGGEQADSFIETMLAIAELALSDPGSAAARVPLAIKVAGELVDKVTHIDFWSEFDGQVDNLRTAAIKRFALGMDLPPEALLGVADVNHWNVWAVNEQTITLQYEPLAEVACYALTRGYLVPAAAAEGLDPSRVIVWYDTSDLRTRPDLTAAATEAHSRIKISDAAYRREVGLSEDDKPDEAETKRRTLIDVAKGAPTLAPAMLTLAGVITEDEAALATALLNGGAPPADGEVPGPAQPEGEPAQPDQSPPVEPETPPPADEGAQSAALVGLVASCDGLVTRALERAGQRLRAAAGKGRPGGAESVACDDPATLHTRLSATEHASLDHMLDGAWTRVPTIAARWGVEPESLAACLDGYTRALLAAGHAHDWDRLAVALGAADDRHLVASH